MFGDPVSNPKGWEKKEFKEYTLDVKNGITRRPKSEEDNSGDKVLKLKNIRSNFINYDCENRIMLVESEKQKFDVKIGDLLFIRVNGNPDYVGRCALHNDINQEVYYNDHIMRVRYNLNYYNGLFLSQYLNYPYGQSEISKQIKTSAGQHTINQGGLEKLNLIIPPIELQNQFAERVKAIEIQKAIAQASLEKSEELFNSLLQKAFKGVLV
jgi:restriction endonuclease S subunit